MFCDFIIINMTTLITEENGPTHEMMVLIAHAQKAPSNFHPEIPNGARDLKFRLSHYLCMNAAKALMRLCICSCASEYSLLDNVIRAKISWAGLSGILNIFSLIIFY